MMTVMTVVVLQWWWLPCLIDNDNGVDDSDNYTGPSSIENCAGLVLQMNLVNMT